jgi:hypothetical protein
LTISEIFADVFAVGSCMMATSLSSICVQVLFLSLPPAWLWKFPFPAPTPLIVPPGGPVGDGLVSYHFTNGTIGPFIEEEPALMKATGPDGVSQTIVIMFADSKHSPADPLL